MSEAIIRRTFIPEIRALDVEKMEVSHLISDATLDRMNDVIDPLGWELDNYKRNPVVLADHNYSIGSIIGKAVDVKASKSGLYATTKFHDVGLGMQAFQLVEAGMARAWSVGFVGKERHSIATGVREGCKTCAKSEARLLNGRDPEEAFIYGYHFTKMELLEYSLVSIPANPSVVMNAVRRGLVDREGAGALFRPADVWVSPEELSAALALRASVDPSTTTALSVAPADAARPGAKVSTEPQRPTSPAYDALMREALRLRRARVAILPEPSTEAQEAAAVEGAKTVLATLQPRSARPVRPDDLDATRAQLTEVLRRLDEPPEVKPDPETDDARRLAQTAAAATALAATLRRPARELTTDDLEAARADLATLSEEIERELPPTVLVDPARTRAAALAAVRTVVSTLAKPKRDLSVEDLDRARAQLAEVAKTLGADEPGPDPAKVRAAAVAGAKRVAATLAKPKRDLTAEDLARARRYFQEISLGVGLASVVHELKKKGTEN